MAKHRRLAHHSSFHFGFDDDKQAEEWDLSQWHKLLRRKRWRSGYRLPALPGKCFNCGNDRPCVVINDGKICYNCAIVRGIKVRRGFADKHHLRVPLAGNGDVPAWEIDDIVLESDLPKGKYFFRFTPEASLDGIRANGLQSSTDFAEKYTVQQESHPVPGESRLFLFPYSEIPFFRMNESIAFDDEEARVVTLRFKRSVLRGVEKVWDNGYGVKVFSCFLRDALVRPNELEICRGTRWDGRRGMHVAKRWTSLVG